MPGRALLLVVGSLLLFGALLGAGGDVAVAAKDPVDIPGSNWLTQGVMKIAASGGAQFVVSQAIVGFGPQDGLSEGEFGVNLDPDGLELIVFGTFFEKVPGKPVCTFDLQEFEDALVATLEPPPEVDFSLRNATFKVTPKNKQGLETIRAFLTIKFVVCAIDDKDRYRCRNATLQYKGVGGRFEM